jgi:hypothetical protein
MISAIRKNLPACRGIAAGIQGLVTLTTRERLVTAGGSVVFGGTSRKTPTRRVGENFKTRGQQ